MKNRILVVSLALVAAVLTGCPSRGPAGPEVTEIPGLALDEDGLVATLDGTRGVRVEVPLRPTGDRAMSGTVRIALVDLGGDRDQVLGEAQTAFSVDGEPATFSLDVRGRDPAVRGADLARYLIRYEVEARTGRIHGARSLWIALPRAEIHLLAPAALPTGGTTHARIFGRDAGSGAPLSGASATVVYESEAGARFTLAETPLGDDGSAAVLLTGPAELSEGTLHAEVRAGDLVASVSREARVVRDATVLLTTDKPRYQPGQTIHLRALSLDRADRTPDPGEVVFEAVDAEGNTVFRRGVETDDHGIAAVSLPLSDELNTGEWTLRARAGGGVAERPVLVERYRLPRFDLALTTDKGHYRPGERIHGAITAHYFFGEIVEGTVEVEASHEDRVLARVTGALADGGFTFNIQLPTHFAGADDGRPVRVALAARVTDTADQSAETSRALPIALGDLELAAVAEGTLATGLPGRILVAVTDPSGAPIAAEVAVSGDGAVLDTETVALDDAGIGAVLLHPYAERPSLTLTATAADGRAVTRDLVLTATSGDALVLHVDRVVHDAGETARVVVFARSEGALPETLSVDLARGARVIATHALALEDGAGEIAIPLPAELSGAVTVEASFIARGSRVVADRRLLFVDGAGALDVSIEAPESVRPGEAGTLSLTVRDETGAGVPAAVGVTVVDRAVLALGGPRPGAEAAALAFDGEVPAPVAGHAVSAVLTGSEAHREAAARLLFAAAGGRSPWTIDESSLRAELSEAKDVVRPRFERTVASLRELLVSDVERGLMTHENAAGWIGDRASEVADVFGQPLFADGGELSTFAIRSAGIDEVLGTTADLSTPLDVWQILREGNPRSTNDCWFFPCGAGDRAEDEAFAGGDPAFDFDDGAPPPEAADGGSASPTRVRSFFPETLLFAPSVITSPSGEATVPFTAADSITTWAIAASASTRDGRLGSGEGDLVVFQDFFVDVSLPPAITRGDEIEVPVAVYNYLDVPLTVSVEAMAEDWYTLLSPAVRTVALEPGEVRGTRFRIRAEGVGMKAFGVHASAGSVADAIRRGVLVEPGGERLEDGSAGPLEAGMPTVTEVHFPEGAVTGSERLYVTVYPGVMAQAVQSMEAIVREPHGCFEQSTSATWPNVMVARYMEATGETEGEAWDRTVAFIEKGHQMLVSYQSPTGGFNWWGNSDPGNRILTAIGLLILRDMDGIIQIDEEVVRRNAEWLAGQQQADGSWPTGDALHAGNEFLGDDAAIATSFAVQALIAAGGHGDAVQRGAAYLAGRVQSGIDAPFTLAASARALAAAGHANTAAATAALVGSAEVDGEGRYTWQAPNNASWTGASGRGAGIETTAVAAQAFLTAGHHPAAAEGALDFLATQVDGFGGWGQTQATVQSIRAFVQSLEASGDTNVLGEIRVTVDGDLVETIPVSPADADVVRTVDLRAFAVPGSTREVGLELVGEGRLMYQVVGVHHVDWAARPGGGLTVDVQHDATEKVVGARGSTQVVAGNTTGGEVDQVLVKVGLAPGMTPVASDLDRFVAEGRLSRWERSATGVVLYIPAIQGGAQADFVFGTVATVAGDLEAPATVAYPYYNPDSPAVFPPVAFTVTE